MSEYIKKIYSTIEILIYVIYAVTLFGLYSIAPQYLTTLQTGLRYFVILFLIARFNPFTWNTEYHYGGNKFTDFDRRVVFSMAVFLFATSVVTGVFLGEGSPMPPLLLGGGRGERVMW